MEIGFTDGKLAEALQAKGIQLDLIKSSGLYVEKKGKDKKPTGEWKDFFCPGLIIFPHRLDSGFVGSRSHQTALYANLDRNHSTS